MRLIFFPALENLHSAINNRNTGDRRYNWKNVLFSLKLTKTQKLARKELIRKLENRLETMRSQGHSTTTSLGDLSNVSTRQLYVTLIMLLNTVYPDYDFSSTTLDSFLPTSPQQLFSQLNDDVFIPLSQDPGYEGNHSAGDLKHTFLSGLKEAIGFEPDSISLSLPTAATSLNYNDDEDIAPHTTQLGETREDGEMADNEVYQHTSVLIPTKLSSPNSSTLQLAPNATTDLLDTSFISTTSSAGTITQQLSQQHQQCFIFEFDNDGDNPLFSPLRLWTKVYLLYSPSLKRVGLITASCRSNQMLYSPVLNPMISNSLNASHHSVNIDSLDDFKLQLKPSARRRGSNRSSGLVDDDDGEDEVDDSDDDSDDNDDDDDDDDDDNDEFGMYGDVDIASPRTDDDNCDDSDEIVRAAHVNSSDDDDDFYLYSAAAPAGSIGIQSHPSRGDFFDGSVGGVESAGMYANHVEMVENAQGEIEIIPLILDPKILKDLDEQQQQQQQRQPQQTNNGPSTFFHPTTGKKITMNQTPDFKATKL